MGWNDAKSWGTGLVNLLIGCVFWQANLKNRTFSAHQSLSIFTWRPQKCIFNDLSDIFIQLYNCLPYLLIFVCLSQSHMCMQDALHIWKSSVWQFNRAIRLSGCHYIPCWNQPFSCIYLHFSRHFCLFLHFLTVFFCISPWLTSTNKRWQWKWHFWFLNANATNNSKSIYSSLFNHVVSH